MIGIATLWAVAELLLQEPRIERIDPPHWWTGLGVDTLELLVEGTGLANTSIRIEGSGVALLSDKSARDSRYRYVTLKIAPQAPAQTVRIIAQGSSSDTLEFPLRTREGGKHRHTGLRPTDAMMLIMVDRFANGDASNDVVPTMRQARVSRSGPFERHGGDLAGVRQHLGYLDSLGITALWLCPVLENDQPRSSYHGYAITDHYAIDPRLGSTTEYNSLSAELHNRSMRLVMDVVLNHVGDQHRLYVRPPDSSWINWWSEYTQTSGRENTNFDPYATEQDQRRFRQGWFDRSMPDLNTLDEHVSRYLIQNTIWWIEEADIDALRVDTYTYPDQSFMNSWVSAVRRTFPGIFIFGESWVDSHASQAYYLEKYPFNKESRLQSTTDFQTYTALRELLTQTSGWDVGTGRLYRTLAADYLYADASAQITFLDNHDLPRIAGVVNKDVRKLRMGLALLLTMRGIPCLTYGTECGFSNTADHGTIREDMPGGWPNENVAFGHTQFASESGLSQWLRSMLHYRRTHPAMSEGTMRHITPQDGIYAIMRSDSSESIVCIVNADDRARSLDASRLDDVLKGRRNAVEIPSGRSVFIPKQITMEPLSTLILSFTDK